MQKEAEAKRLAQIEVAKQRAAQEARRQAVLEEQRRRQQAIREAQARKLAFERGLRTETVENITNDNPEGEDLEVRRAAVNALGTHAGTVVVLEPQTGKVLSIVNQDWAIRKSFKPCSTIKLVTAIAGINENVIDLRRQYLDAPISDDAGRRAGLLKQQLFPKCRCRTWKRQNDFLRADSRIGTADRH